MAVIGGIIGGGIFRTPATVAERAGTPALTLAAWAVGGVIALIGALCFAELGQRRPRAGGGYVYLRETWGPLTAFLYGWALLLVIATGAMAAVAVTFAGYALALAGLPERLTLPLAIAAIVALSGINWLGVRPGALTQNILTLLKLGALAALIVVGLAAAVPAAAAPPLPHPAAASGWGVGSLGAALVPVVFTYGGWQQTNFLGEEIIEPEKNLPRALVFGVAVVVAVYMLANLAYLRVLGAGGLAASTAPAADTMERLVGPAGRTLIAGGIAVSALGFLNLVILVTPRVLQAMAADGLFFPRLAKLHPVHRTPTAAIGFLAVWAVALTLSGTFGQLVDYVTFADWIFFGLTAAGLFIYRSRDAAGGLGGVGFRVPGYPWTPALFVAAAFYVVLSSVLANLRNAAVGGLLIGLGVPVYRYWNGRSRRHPA